MPCPGSQSPVGCARTLWWSSRLPHAWGGGHGRLPVVKLAVSGVKHPRLSVVKFPDLAPVTWKYCWSCENSCASQPQCAGLSETAKNWFDPIFMGEYRGNSILISLECVKWLSDQICRYFWSLSHFHFTHAKDNRRLLPIGLEN